MIELFYVVFIVFLIYLLERNKDFIYVFPMFQVVVDASFSYFPVLSFATFYRAAMLIIFVLYFIKYIRPAPIANNIYAFLILSGILAVGSQELLYSLKAYSQVFLSMIMFPIGLYFINTDKKYDKLINSLVPVIYISLAFILMGYLFHAGKSLEYSSIEGEEDIIGLLGSGGLYSAGIGLGLLPIILPQMTNRWKKRALIIAAVIQYIFILLNVRRTAIIIPLIGILVAILYMKRNPKLIIGLVSAILLFIILLPFYEGILIQRIGIREQQRQNKFLTSDFYKQEARYKENISLFGEYLEFAHPLNDLLALNNNAFAENIKNSKSVSRMYHTDTAKLLYGTGIVGLLLYLLIILKAFEVIFKYRRKGAKNNKYFITSLSLLLIILFVTFNGSITLIAFRSILFLILGASTGMQRRTYIKYLYLTKIYKENKINGRILSFQEQF